MPSPPGLARPYARPARSSPPCSGGSGPSRPPAGLVNRLNWGPVLAGKQRIWLAWFLPGPRTPQTAAGSSTPAPRPWRSSWPSGAPSPSAGASSPRLATTSGRQFLMKEKRKQPYFIYRTDGGAPAFAGIYELWRDEALSANHDQEPRGGAPQNGNTRQRAIKSPAVRASARPPAWPRRSAAGRRAAGAPAPGGR